MHNYRGQFLCYLGAAFRPKTSPIFSWRTRNLSATNQKWSLWLHTKDLVDMFSPFWIRSPLTFRKNSTFHPLWRFSANNFTSRNATLFIFSLTFVPYSLFRGFYLSLLFNFKIGLSLGHSYIMSSMFITIILIIPIN